MTRRRGTIVIADDHQILRDAIAQSIAKAAGLYVAECVGDAQAAINACSNVKPDILLLDIEMPGRDALGAVIDVRAVSPDTRVVILSAFCKDAMIDLSLRAGVAGYLVKQNHPRASSMLSPVCSVASRCIPHLCSPESTNSVPHR